ncbi:hypothetical protein KP509_20G015300 [Ceratopteris richardii]|uniref:EamA domain-containing protein n=1 Tax=Ceratopteris richardii TaxID=49495 RepID=A0A8T2SDC8_CERRI|nr:hypothetical protein KP509_20G015300 [Ceratopteris richardii]
MASSTSWNSIAVCSTSTPYLPARRLSCPSFLTSRVPCCPTSISLTSYELTIYFKRRWQSCKRGRFVFLATMRNKQYNDLNERSVDSSPTVRSDVTSKYNPASFEDKSETRETELQCVGTGSNVDCVVSESNSDSAVGNVTSPASSVSDQKMPYEFINQERATNMECIGTGTDVECVIPDSTSSNRIASRAVTDPHTKRASTYALSDSSEAGLLGDDGENQRQKLPSFLSDIWESLVLISPFFFWGTAMVAMKGILPKAGPLFVAATRLIPSGLLLVSFAGFRGRKQPSGLNAWLAITLFALVDAACFQGFLAEGLKRTSAGLGSVIIDSQPLTVAVLASILFGETIGALGVLGLATGILGLLLLEVPTQLIENFLHAHGLNSLGPSVTTSTAANGWTIWDSGEWWMLLAAQSMAIGTVMVRWICQFADPVMATGWHMVLGGIPLLALASIQHDPALAGHIQDLELVDWLALVYTSVFGSAVSYGVFFYNASRGSLTKLSSLTFLTPMFAAFFGMLKQ